MRIDADDSALRKELASKLTAAADSQIVGMVGKTLILYRQRDEKPGIKLPK